MKPITSRSNPLVRHFRKLASDGNYRRETGEFVCDGHKMLDEARLFGAEINCILWKEGSPAVPVVCREEYILPADLFDYVSSMKNSPGPLFSVRIPEYRDTESIRSAVVLENVQDPGNVGTVLRTANAFRIDSVLLTGECADLYNPKTIRSTMGAVFRQRVDSVKLENLSSFLFDHGLKLYGAALSDDAEDLRNVNLDQVAVAIGSEGRGLSAECLSLCERKVVIPMSSCSESLNAAIASAVIMWEMKRMDL